MIGLKIINISDTNRTGTGIRLADVMRRSWTETCPDIWSRERISTAGCCAVYANRGVVFICLTSDCPRVPTDHQSFSAMLLMFPLFWNKKNLDGTKHHLTNAVLQTPSYKRRLTNAVLQTPSYKRFTCCVLV